MPSFSRLLPAEQKGFHIHASSPHTAAIYLYDEIGGWGMSAHRFTEQLLALGEISHIDLHIHSPGGDVFDGIAIYNQLHHHAATISVYIDGLAASMASVIAMVGDNILMPKNAMMMIHKPWGISCGDANEIRHYADLLDKIEETLIPAYQHKTGKSCEALRMMLSAETWLNADECLAQGFVDQIIDPVTPMARLSSKRLDEFTAMPQTFKNQLISPRNSQQPTSHNLIQQERNAQQSRINQIKDLFALFGDSQHTLMLACLSDIQCSLDNAKDKLLAALGKEATPTHNIQHPVHIYAGNGNLVGDSIRASLMARAGYEAPQTDNYYNGMTLRELARISLTDRGIGSSAEHPMQMVANAFTHSSSDFGQILLDVAHKAILQGWDEAEETYDQWTKKGQLSDFKTAHRVNMGGFPSLRKVREGAQYQYVTTGDEGATIALATYGELFCITRQAIINDDLNQFTDVPKKLGRAAKGTIGDLVYSVLNDNPMLNHDKKNLFVAEHNNILIGQMDVETLSHGRKLMRRQKEGSRALNIRPAFILVPVALESQALQVIGSGSVKGTDSNANIINPIRNFATVIAEPRLDDQSESTWYMAAAKGSDTLEVAYLSGIDTPYIDQQEGFTSDGITSKVRIDAGVAPLDYRGLIRVGRSD